jgi:hypothetical protein
MAEDSVREPEILIAALPASVPVKPVKSILLHPVFPVAIVTVVLPENNE